MILGMSVGTFTTLHVIISLVGIATGVVMLYSLLTSRSLPGWTAAFLVSTALTSATGFLFHSKSIGPPHVVGAISLVILALAAVAVYIKHRLGGWRVVYVVTAITALYLNGFVAVVQGFQKVGFLRNLAPTQTELPFVAAQGALLVAFVVLGILAVKRYHVRQHGVRWGLSPAR